MIAMARVDEAAATSQVSELMIFWRTSLALRSRSCTAPAPCPVAVLGAALLSSSFQPFQTLIARSGKSACLGFGMLPSRLSLLSLSFLLAARIMPLEESRCFAY